MYSEIVFYDFVVVDFVVWEFLGIVFFGGLVSVYVEGAPWVDFGVYELGVLILGICYGVQLIVL